MADEEDDPEGRRRHRERYGRLDVLVNNAGVGIGAPVGETQTKRLDMQLDVNLRSIDPLLPRVRTTCCAAAGAEHERARREHRLDRRQVRPGVAVGLRGDQVRPWSAAPRR